MPLYQVDIEKNYLGEYWTNRYLITAEDLVEAEGYGSQIVSFEQIIHADGILFTKMRVSDTFENTDQYVSIALNTFGAYNVNEALLLPLFNVARVDFSPTAGRPSRKYLRGVLTEDDINYNQIVTNRLNSIQTDYVAPLMSLVPFVDPQQSVFFRASVSPFVGMRQLRRGSRRRTQPVLP